jgi:hypothetical protein
MTDDGAKQKMIRISDSSRQPTGQPWTMDRLVHERSITLGYSLDTSTFGTYTSALNYYLYDLDEV